MNTTPNDQLPREDSHLWNAIDQAARIIASDRAARIMALEARPVADDAPPPTAHQLIADDERLRQEMDRMQETARTRPVADDAPPTDFEATSTPLSMGELDEIARSLSEAQERQPPTDFEQRTTNDAPTTIERSYHFDEASILEGGVTRALSRFIEAAQRLTTEMEHSIRAAGPGGVWRQTWLLEIPADPPSEAATTLRLRAHRESEARSADRAARFEERVAEDREAAARREHGDAARQARVEAFRWEPEETAVQAQVAALLQDHATRFEEDARQARVEAFHRNYGEAVRQARIDAGLRDRAARFEEDARRRRELGDVPLPPAEEGEGIQRFEQVEAIIRERRHRQIRETLSVERQREEGPLFPEDAPADEPTCEPAW